MSAISPKAEVISDHLAAPLRAVPGGHVRDSSSETGASNHALRELSDIADNLPLRRLQEKVINLLGSVTRVSVETVRIVDAMNEGRC
jgi:hypothetical protein